MVDRIDDSFDRAGLDRDVWFPWYLPHWSSRAETAASFEVVEDGLRLFIPPEQGNWCVDLHEEPLRVSCVQTGTWSGPVGSSLGQQPFRKDLTVREEQPEWWGYTPWHGTVEIEMRGVVTPRSMFALWMSGIEDAPERSGEICVAEIFGDAISDGVVQVGMGVHRFRDPALVEEFATEPLELAADEMHRYRVDWRAGSLDFFVDDHHVRHLDQAPDYPMQLMIGVFDFPAKATAADADAVPEMVVRRIWSEPAP